jgi:hypothetical protein
LIDFSLFWGASARCGGVLRAPTPARGGAF